MAVMAREDAWTDKRLDDLSARVEKIDRRVETGFTEMRAEFKAVRAEARKEFQAVRGEMEGIRTEIGALNRTVVQFAGAVVGTIFLSSMGTIAALITIA